jgi:hypothetical protein
LVFVDHRLLIFQDSPRVEGAEPVWIEWLPACGEESGVADLFVGPAAFAVKIGRGFRREGALKTLGEAGEEGALEEWSRVRDIKKARGVAGEVELKQVGDGPGRILNVDLIDPTAIGSGGRLAADIDHRLAGEEIFEQHGAAGAVDPSETADDASSGEGLLLRLAEDLAGLAVRPGRGGFSDDFTPNVRINAGAGGKKDLICLRESGAEITAAFEVNGSVCFTAAAAPTGSAMDNVYFCGTGGFGDRRGGCHD